MSRLGIPQPQYGRDCTLALWNPLTNSFQWVAVDCHEDVFVSAVVCYVNEGLERMEGPVISYCCFVHTIAVPILYISMWIAKHVCF